MLSLLPIFKKISTVSKKIKIPAYLVGGFVRDWLIGETSPQPSPLKGEGAIADIDIVVEGSGIAFAKAFDNVLKQKGRLVEFPDFDTARYILFDKNDEVELELEFAGARSESYRAESRKPAVEKAALEQDLSRRDFTVNAMAVRIDNVRDLLLTSSSAEEEGRSHHLLRRGEGRVRTRVVDPFNGLQDLKDKILRTPLDPDATFSDDPLRMMRAIRFAGQLNFAIEPKTLEAIHRNRERMKIVSAERVQEELLKILALPQPSTSFLLMFQTHVLDEILSELSALHGVDEVKGRIHKDNFIHSLMVVDNIALRSKKVMLRMAGLLHDIGKAPTRKYIRGRGWTFYQHEHLGKKMVHEICRRMRFSVDNTKYIAKLVRWHLQPIQLMDAGITDSAIRRLIVTMGDLLDDLLILGRSDITTGVPWKRNKYLGNYDRLEKRVAEVIAKDKLRAFQSPVRGDEIMAITGLKPGPKVGDIKEAIEEAILDGVIPNEYEAAKSYLFGLLKKEGIKIVDKD